MRLGLPGGTLLAMDPTLAGTVSPASVYETPVGGWIDRPVVGIDRFATDLLLAEGPEAVSPWRATPADWPLPAEVRLFLEDATPPPGDAGTPTAAR